MHICIGRITDAGVTRAQRQELAAAVLWFHTHVNDPVPALDRLSFESQELLAECFVEDFVVYAGDPIWRVKLSCFLKFTAASGSTPKKRAALSHAPAASASPAAPASGTAPAPTPGGPGPATGGSRQVGDRWLPAKRNAKMEEVVQTRNSYPVNLIDSMHSRAYTK